jgi:hypothetical protein
VLLGQRGEKGAVGLSCARAARNAFRAAEKAKGQAKADLNLRP